MSPALWAAAAAALTVLLWWVPAKPLWTPGARGEGGLAGWGAGNRRGAGAGRGTAGQAASDHTGGVSTLGATALGFPARGATLRGVPARGGHARGQGPGLVPEALELLALALQGGGSLGAATAQVASVLPAPRAAQLALVADALRSGEDAASAWASAGVDWDPARRSLELAHVAGVAPAPALRQAAADLRRDAIGDVEVATARLGVRLVLPLGLTFLPAFVLITVLPLVLALTRDLVW